MQSPAHPSEFAVVPSVGTDGSPTIIVRNGTGADASYATIRGTDSFQGLAGADFVVLLADLLRPGWIALSRRIGPDMPVLPVHDIVEGQAPTSEGTGKGAMPRIIRRRVFSREASEAIPESHGAWHVELGTATTFDDIADVEADCYPWSAFHRHVFPRFE